MTDNQSPASDQTEELIDTLAAAYADALRDGKNPSIDDYVTANPQLENEIKELFPTILAVEQLKNPRDEMLSVAQLGDYKLGKLIGSGAMGQVFEARQEKLDRRIAIKILPKTESHALARFDREMKLVAALEHPHIIPVYDAGEAEGLHYFAMRYVDGMSVAELIDFWLDNGPPELSKQAGEDPKAYINATLKQRQVLGDQAAPQNKSWTAVSQSQRYRCAAYLISQAAHALQYAHDKKVLHRDIKPANLMLEDGRCYLADFGIAKGEHYDTITASGTIPGTIRYMAPEQFAGEGDHRADIYALGITLLESASLFPAFTLTGGRTSMVRVILDGLPNPRNIDRDLPQDLADIISKACHLEADQRYHSAEDLAEDLESFVKGESLKHIGNSTARNVLIGLVLLLTVALAMWANNQEQQPTEQDLQSHSEQAEPDKAVSVEQESQQQNTTQPKNNFDDHAEKILQELNSQAEEDEQKKKDAKERRPPPHHRPGHPPHHRPPPRRD